MPLQDLIDEICTTGEEITTSQLTRIQQYLIGEHGFSADEINKFKEPLLFFGHLRDKKFISFANLAFFQAVLTRIERQDLCDIVSDFARDHSFDALYLEVSKIDKGSNARVNLHVRKTLTKRNEVDTIVKSLASCLNIPAESIRVMGAEATNSYRLTLYIPARYRDRLVDKNMLNHLMKVDIDEVEVDGETIKLTSEDRN
ncbi:uncharacterized protein LOC124279806 [Haliotis rubra]|uniref:uncharacterized protein LOC124279806 n=1 Tax=Haliotis rubra TaxID=36100 RepID=UPI001EE5F4A4|nr:uncharacterized protein LOC124279806 [Haliotis rubra]